MVDLKAVVRIEPAMAEAIGLGPGSWGLLLCESTSERYALAGDATLAEMLGYFDLRFGETITVQPQTFHLQRYGWPPPTEIQGGTRGNSDAWTPAPARAEVAVVSSRVGMVLECLRHYAASHERGARPSVVSDVEAIVAVWDDNIAGMDLSTVLAPLGSKQEISYYDASYFLFRALAGREKELDALDIAIAGWGLPQPASDASVSRSRA